MKSQESKYIQESQTTGKKGEESEIFISIILRWKYIENFNKPVEKPTK